jgi:signal transduction histidine kinase
MSNRTRAVLGEPARIGETIPTGRTRPLRVWRVWGTPESTIVAAQPLERAEDLSSGLFDLQSRWLEHFFHLLAMEQSLSLRARRKRPGGGRAAIHQMEMERRRLGRELHTGAGQMLAAIRLQLELIAAQMPEPPLEVRQALDRIGVLAGETLEQVRAISKRLHPPEWQRLTLEQAIRRLWDLSGIPRGFEARLEIDPLPSEPALEVKILTYRAVQEAFSNLLRHAKATRVRVSLHYSDGRLTLEIEDNGVGFNVEQVLHGPADVSAGIGLRSVREQAEALGGKMTVESGPSGTKLVVSTALFPGEE